MSVLKKKKGRPEASQEERIKRVGVRDKEGRINACSLSKKKKISRSEAHQPDGTREKNQGIS